VTSVTSTWTIFPRSWRKIGACENWYYLHRIQSDINGSLLRTPENALLFYDVQNEELTFYDATSEFAIILLMASLTVVQNSNRLLSPLSPH